MRLRLLSSSNVLRIPLVTCFLIAACDLSPAPPIPPITPTFHGIPADISESPLITPTEEPDLPQTTVLNTTRPDDLYQPYLPSPDFSKIKFTWLGNGYTRVDGAVGAIPGAHPVYVVSPNTAYAATTHSDTNGRFSLLIVAPPGSWVIVKYDPTNGFLMPDVWFNLVDDSGRGPGGYPHVLEDSRPSVINAAPGGMSLIPFVAPKGDGVPFVIAGSTFPEHLDFQISGNMTKSEDQLGESIDIEGLLTLYTDPKLTETLEEKTLSFTVHLYQLFNSDGVPRTPENQFFSTTLTNTGLPIENRRPTSITKGILSSTPFTHISGSNSLRATFKSSVEIPKDLPDGKYALWIDPSTEPTGASLGGPRPEVNPLIASRALSLPPFTIGTPQNPRLVWGLLTDVPSADGTRGVLTEEDARTVQISNRIATQSPYFIIPRISKETGEPIRYRLEPYLPMLAHGDRYIPNVPTITLKLPSGSLSVEIVRPDGGSDIIGPSPFSKAVSRTPMTSEGIPLDDGGGHLADVLQISTLNDDFSYEFPSYGKYKIRMTGSVEDIYGNTYTGGGTYLLFVAKPLDIEPAILPMTPLQVGNTLNPGVTVLPGVPADIEVRVTLLINSDPENSVDYAVTGKANRFGLFTPAYESQRILMEGEGEFVVDTIARYTDPDGIYWMGATRWGSVVASPTSPLIAHGRRGRDSVPVSKAKSWFISDRTDDSHVWIPYHSGDILWQRDGDAARISITVQDTQGVLDAAISAIESSNVESSTKRHATLGQFPLTLGSREEFNSSYPRFPSEEYPYIGYWYAGVQRPGERVRELVSDDTSASAYWRFGELYAMQPGMGIEGDLPNDVKFQFGGAVFRDSAQNMNHYAIYSSLWVQLPDNDRLGSRVFPPFQGAAGGPNGGPIMVLGEREIDLFILPLAIRPGTILEVGDVFSFSGQVGPPLASNIELTITGPANFLRTISGNANKVGYFYDPDQDFILEAPGKYHVTVSVQHTGMTSAGPVVTPYPTGSILSPTKDGFDIYVVEEDSTLMQTTHSSANTITGIGTVPFSIKLPDGLNGSIHYTIAMPGFLLDNGTLITSGNSATVNYDPVHLAKTFQNIDLQGRVGSGTLADTVWVSLLLEQRGHDGLTSYYARQFTLQGPDLFTTHPANGALSENIPRSLTYGNTNNPFGCPGNSTITFHDDFENGASAWVLEPSASWDVVELSDGNHVLNGRGRVQALLRDNLQMPGEYWRVRVRSDKGQVHFNVKVPESNRYAFKFDTAYSELQLYQPMFPGRQVDATYLAHPDGIWHDIEFTLIDTNIRISVNGVLETVFIDPQPVSIGSVWLEVIDGDAYFDNVLVCNPL